jgi:ribosomal protein L37AE/L43A
VFINSFTMSLRYSCRHCNSTSYKRVIQRDAQGEMRPSELYSCSGCSVVFANPEAWRQVTPPVAEQRLQTGAPNFPTGWMPITDSAR